MAATASPARRSPPVRSGNTRAAAPSRGRAPVPPRHKGPKDGHKEHPKEQPRREGREQHRERKAGEPRKPAPAPKVEEAPKFSFKPFAALTGAPDGGSQEG